MTLPTIDQEKTTFQPLPPDVYHAKLLEIEPKEGLYGPFWTWKFEVDANEVPKDGDYSTWQWAFTNCNLNPLSTSKGSPRKIVAALLGRALKDEEFRIEGGEEYEALVGMPCRLSIGIGKSKKDGEPRNEVNAVLPLKKSANEVPPAQSAPALISRKNELKKQLQAEGKYDDFVAWYTDKYNSPFDKIKPLDMAAVIEEMEARADLEF